MNSIAKMLAALLLSAGVLLGGSPAGAEETTAPGTTEAAKADNGAKGAEGAKKKKKGAKKKKKGAKKKKAASATASASARA